MGDLTLALPRADFPPFDPAKQHVPSVWTRFLGGSIDMLAALGVAIPVVMAADNVMSLDPELFSGLPLLSEFTPGQVCARAHASLRL